MVGFDLLPQNSGQVGNGWGGMVVSLAGGGNT